MNTICLTSVNSQRSLKEKECMPFNSIWHPEEIQLHGTCVVLFLSK